MSECLVLSGQWFAQPSPHIVTGWFRAPEVGPVGYKNGYQKSETNPEMVEVRRCDEGSVGFVFGLQTVQVIDDARKL